MNEKIESLINFLIGKKEGWTPIGKAIDKLDFLWFLPNEHRISIFKVLLCLFIFNCVLSGITHPHNEIGNHSALSNYSYNYSIPNSTQNSTKNSIWDDNKTPWGAKFINGSMSLSNKSIGVTGWRIYENDTMDDYAPYLVTTEQYKGYTLYEYYDSEMKDAWVCIQSNGVLYNYEDHLAKNLLEVVQSCKGTIN